MEGLAAVVGANVRHRVQRRSHARRQQRNLGGGIEPHARQQHAPDDGAKHCWPALLIRKQASDLHLRESITAAEDARDGRRRRLMVRLSSELEVAVDVPVDLVVDLAELGLELRVRDGVLEVAFHDGRGGVER
jgi:hypothetical protein